MKKRINDMEMTLSQQLRENAELGYNATGHFQDQYLYFVQFDDNYAVASDGSIYQIVEQRDLPIDGEVLFYHGENVSYNYAEDNVEDFDEESREIIEHCLEQAELLGAE